MQSPDEMAAWLGSTGEWETFQDGTKKQNQEEHMQMIPRMHIRYGVMM
jgi:hypothetical protein